MRTHEAMPDEKEVVFALVARDVAEHDETQSCT